MRYDRRSVLRSIDVTYKEEREYFHKTPLGHKQVRAAGGVSLNSALLVEGLERLALGFTADHDIYFSSRRDGRG